MMLPWWSAIGLLCAIVTQVDAATWPFTSFTFYDEHDLRRNLTETELNSRCYRLQDLVTPGAQYDKISCRNPDRNDLESALQQVPSATHLR